MQHVIRTEDIRALAEAHLEGTPGFLVDVVVSDGSNIRVIVDHDENTSIEFCMGLSRHIEGSLDREVQDFSLDVTSPGLDKPLKLHRQYLKNVGRDVAVMPVEGAKIEGELKAVEEDHFVVQTREKRRIEGRVLRLEVAAQERGLRDRLLLHAHRCGLHLPRGVCCCCTDVYAFDSCCLLRCGLPLAPAVSSKL